MQDDLVTVITPLYNCEHYIEETIRSVQSQTYKNVEYIIINDGSSDQSASIVRKSMESDSRIQFIDNTQNLGAAFARNTAIDLSKGRYIAFIDSDDLWEKDKLSYQIEFMEKQKAAFSFTSYIQITGEGKRIREIRVPTRLSYQKQLLYNHIGTSTVVYDQSIIGKLHFPNIRKRQDYGMWLKILKNGYTGFGIQKCFSSYRIRKGSVSSSKIDMVRYNWRLYREIEKLGLIHSLFYLSTTIFSKILKIK